MFIEFITAEILWSSVRSDMNPCLIHISLLTELSEFDLLARCYRHLTPYGVKAYVSLLQPMQSANVNE